MNAITEKLRPFTSDERIALLEKKLDLRTDYITVCLQDIYYPQNAGAILRTSEAFGIQHVHIIEDKNPFEINHKVEKGAAKWLHLHRYGHKQFKDPNQAAVDQLKKEGYRIVVTSPHQSSCTPFDLDLSKGKIALIMGTEKDGASEWMLQQADEYLHIDMAGFVESLNVSVCAAIALNVLCKRLRESNLPWKLDPQSKEAILEEWVKKSVRSIDPIMKLIEDGKL